MPGDVHVDPLPVSALDPVFDAKLLESELATVTGNHFIAVTVLGRSYEYRYHLSVLLNRINELQHVLIKRDMEGMTFKVSDLIDWNGNYFLCTVVSCLFSGLE